MAKDKAKEKIEQACLELLNTIPLDAMRTQDLMKKAGVSRSTFYRLFPDKYDVAVWVYKKQVEEVLRLKPALRDWKEWTRVEHDYMRAHKQFFRNIASYRGQNSFEEFLCRYYENNSLRMRTNRGTELTEEQRYANYAFSVIAARSTIDWIMNNFQPDDDTIILRNEACIPPCIRCFYE